MLRDHPPTVMYPWSETDAKRAMSTRRPQKRVKNNALEKLKELRATGSTAMKDYDTNVERVYDEVTERDYQTLVRKRLAFGN